MNHLSSAVVRELVKFAKMEVTEFIVSIIKLVGICVALNLLWAIFSAILSKRRGRNAWNWFFLTCIYGLLGLLFLACSKTLNEKERDTLAKVLWWVVAIPAVILTTLLIVLVIEKKKDEELTQKVLQDMKTEQVHEHREQANKVYKDNSNTFSSGIEKNQNAIKHKHSHKQAEESKPYVSHSSSSTIRFVKGKEKRTDTFTTTYLYSDKIVHKSIEFTPADLNDYFDAEEADWNYTEISDEEIEYLRSKNVFLCDTIINGTRFAGWYLIVEDVKTQKK